MTKGIMITGANGYVGSRLADSLSADGVRVIRWQRANADLRCDNPFTSLDPGEISTIVHCAAVTRFNVEPELAQSVNVEGTRKLMEFARQCPNLDQFVLVSSVYASGLTPGRIEERPIAQPPGFSNHYEQSKWQCEEDVRTSDLPWRIARVATVVSDSVQGEVSQFNAVHNTLKLFYYGMLSLIPGYQSSKLYFVTGDFVTRSLRAILDTKKIQDIYHVSTSALDAVSLGTFIEMAYNTFLLDESFKRRRILPPLYADIDSFLSLSDTMVRFGQGIMSQASASVSPFAKQLFVQKDVCTDKLAELLPTSTRLEMHSVIERMCQWLAENKWGRVQNAIS